MMIGCLKVIIGLGIIAALAFTLAACGKGAVNTVPNPQPSPIYTICDTPDCGDNVTIKVE